ncbi:hypothetical protein WR25_08699 isoform B [Diploscapter pachys]|uniref:Uncharacterized protein n=1 Tax=Diploscapter pachys TaxID=2018661 RepID=A0A2A2L1Z8_9BILA|nr:hypothetical protein WR25_08699 isoform B [Diploscapter pachys]
MPSKKLNEEKRKAERIGRNLGGTEKEYKLASADELLTELVAKVDASRQPYEAITTEEEEGFVQAHWPTWAIVLCLGCIFLTIIAFLVGIHLSKRRTPLRLFFRLFISMFD